MKYLYLMLLMFVCYFNVKATSIEPEILLESTVATQSITIRTTSKSSSWSPTDIINSGATLVWSVSGGVTIGEKKINDPTFDLSKNSGTAIITIKSSTNFVGLKRMKIENLMISVVNLIAAKDLFVFRAYKNQMKIFKAEPSMLKVLLNDNLLTSSELDGIINDLDGYGLKNGILEIKNNKGTLTEASIKGYQNLKNKGWTINVPSPSGTDPSPDPSPDPGTSNSLTIRTTSTSSAWSPTDIINTGTTLVWSVSGGVTIGEKKINIPTFNLSKNSGTAIITVKSSTNFVGLKRMKIENLKVSEVNLTRAKDLFVFRAYKNQIKTFKAEPSMSKILLNDNLLTSSALDGIVNDLDGYGLKSGILEIKNNPGALTETSYNSYRNLKNKGWAINVPSPSNSPSDPNAPEDPNEPEDPTNSGGASSGLLNFRILASQPNRVYFDSSKKITASNVTGFIISGNTISGVRINSGKTTGHYFTVKSSFNFWDNSLIRYKGGSNFKDTSGNRLNDFTLRYIVNKLPEPSATKKIYYVSTSGKDSNSGLSKSSAWRTITKAAKTATAGSTVWIKAGDYGSESVVMRNNGTATNPIKFIGYDASIGDNPKLTRKIGMSFNSGKMPLLKRGSVAINSYNKEYIIVRNIQIENYSSHGFNINNSDYFIIDNVYIKDGKMGIHTVDEYSTNNRVLNSYVADCTQSGVRLDNKNNLIDNVWAVSSRSVGMDYYITLLGGTKGAHNIIRNSYVHRYGNDTHSGHGISLKGDQHVKGYSLEYNLVENCKVINSKIQVRHRPVKYNVIRNCIIDGDKGISINDGASYNTFENITVKNSDYFIRWFETIENGGKHENGHHNVFINSVGYNIKYLFDVGTYQSNQVNLIEKNSILNCTFNNVNEVYSKPILIDNTNKITNCIFNSVAKTGNSKMNAKQTYNNYYNGFKKVSGTGNISLNPDFVNKSSGNFRLRSSSKLIDAGTVLEVVSKDCDENERPSGKSHDIGAFEFQKTSASKSSEIVKDVQTKITTLSSTLCLGESTSLTSDEADSYLWNTGETQKSIIVKPEVTTTYSLTIFKNGVSYSGSTSVVVEDCRISNSKSNLNEGFLVYPNPTQGELNLNVRNPYGDTRIELVNFSGRIVYVDKMTNKSGVGYKQLDLSNIAKGVYFLKVYNRDEYLVKKIILN